MNNSVFYTTYSTGLRTWRWVALAFVSTSLLGCSDVPPPGETSESYSTAESGITLHPLGAKRDSAATIAAHLKPSSAPPGGLPSSVNLENQVPPPGDQMSMGSCTAFGVGYAAKSFHETVEEGWDPTALNHRFSPSWIYNQINGGVDGGSWPSDALQLMVDSGAETISAFPYVDGDFTTQPTAKTFQHAAHFKAKSWSTLPVSEVSFKNVLARHNVVIIAFEVLPDYDAMNDTTNTVYDNDSGSSRGGHVNAIIGYNDTKHAFRIINSWGTSWAQGGYGWIDYSFITNAKLALSAYVMEDGYNDPIVGDANEDLCVNSADYQILINAYGGCKPATKYDYRADFNNDGCVNMKDYQLLAAHMNEGC